MGITAKKEEKKHLLSHEETLDLIQKVQNGDEEAKALLISSNLGLVRSVIGKFSNIGYERDDLFQLGSIKQLAIKVKMQGEMLSKKLGRDPTIEELAEAIGVEKEDVVMAIESNFSVEYLQGVIHEEEGSPICLIDKISQKGEAEEDKVVDNILLKEVLGKLDKRERQIIMLRYFEDKTQSEIGELLNISQVQVSRIEKKVLHKLKSYIEM